MKFIEILDEEDLELFTNITNAFAYNRIDPKVVNDLALAKRTMLRRDAKVFEKYDHSQRKFYIANYVSTFKFQNKNDKTEVLCVKDVENKSFKLEMSNSQYIDGAVPRDKTTITSLSFGKDTPNKVFLSVYYEIGDCSHSDDYFINIDDKRNVLSITKCYLEDSSDYSNTKIMNERVL